MKAIIEITDYNKEEYMKDTLHVPFAIGRGKSEWYDTNLKVEPYEEANDREALANEIWEFAKNIIDLSFKGEYINSEIYNSSTYEEAKAKYEAWKSQKDEIHVGDEVEQITNSGNVTGLKCIVTYIDGNERMHGIRQNGNSVVCSSQVNRWWRKTGLHFNEIEELLKKMKEDEQDECVD